MTARKKLMFYCQHVLGMGHLIRSGEIVRGLKEFDVVFLNGGEIVPGFELPASVEVINLPPIKSDAEFRGLRSAGNEQNLDKVKENRAQRLLAEYERVQPDMLVIELFPFGRLKFAFELMPLLERCNASGKAKRRTKVACSLRDILVGKRKQQQFEEQACRVINQYFDLLLIHSDPRFQRLDETFASVAQIKSPIRYTGFVAQTIAAEVSPPVGEHSVHNNEKQILVSIGGGRVGSELIDCAMDASNLLADRLPHRMLVFGGPYLPEEELQRLQAKAAGRKNVRLEHYTTQFLSHLNRADLSISMAGYNTCMNIVATCTRAIVYPFTGNGDQEQTIRANKLRELGIVEVIHGDELNPAKLAEKILSTLSKSKPDVALLDLKGVEQTAAILAELVSEATQ